MACSYVIYRDRRLVITTGRGRVTLAEITEHRDQLIADADFHPDFNQLIDFTAVTSLDVSMDEAKSVARHPHFSSRSRRAFVATTPDIFAMGRFMAAHDELARGPEHIGVFSALDAALEWLGADPLLEAIRSAPAKPASETAPPVNGQIA